MSTQDTKPGIVQQTFTFVAAALSRAVAFGSRLHANSAQVIEDRLAAGIAKADGEVKLIETVADEVDDGLQDLEAILQPPVVAGLRPSDGLDADPSAKPAT